MIRLEFVLTVEMYIQTTMIGKGIQNVIVLKANRSQYHRKCERSIQLTKWQLILFFIWKRQLSKQKHVDFLINYSRGRE